MVSAPAKWENLKGSSKEIAKGGHTSFLETPPLPQAPLLKSMIS